MNKSTAFIATLALICLVIVGYTLKVGMEGSETPATAQVAQPAPVPPTRDELLQLVNEERAKVGVAPLIADSMLEQSAQWKADDMATYGYFGHVKPGTTGMNGLDYLAALDLKTGDRCSYISENVTDNIYMNDADSAVNAWVESKPHYDAMIDSEYTFTGFGISGTKVTQHFCQTY